jgi:hypothetical protein
MTLEESTAWALAAVEAGNLHDVARAIAARRKAIAEAVASGRPPTPDVMAQVIQAGDRVCDALEAVKREIHLESARLRHVHSRFSRADSQAPQISLRG